MSLSTKPPDISPFTLCHAFNVRITYRFFFPPQNQAHDLRRKQTPPPKGAAPPIYVNTGQK